MDGAVPAGAWPDNEQLAALSLPGLVHSQPSFLGSQWVPLIPGPLL